MDLTDITSYPGLQSCVFHIEPCWHHTVAAVWRESPGPTTTNIVLIYGVRNFLLGSRVHQAWPGFTTWLLVHMMCKSFVYRSGWSQLQIFPHQLWMLTSTLAPCCLLRFKYLIISAHLFFHVSSQPCAFLWKAANLGQKENSPIQR